METRDAIKRATSLIVSVAFLVGVWLPLAQSTLGFAPERESTEKRVLAQLPSVRPLHELPRSFEAWYNDHFGFRNRLIRWHNILKAQMLRTAPNTEVVIGKDGWLYFAGQLNIELYRSEQPMPKEILDGWELYLTEVNEFLADRGIPYLLVIAPAKPTIHPEHLPDHVFRVGETTRLDQFLERIATTDVDVLDLRPGLLAANAVKPTYSKTDTHWSAWGSFTAYCLLQEKLSTMFPSIHPVDPGDFVQREQEQLGGDITTLMGLEDRYPDTDVVFEFEVDPESEWTEEGLLPGKHAYHQPIVSIHPDQSLPRLLMYHDSFGPQIAEFLPTSFSRAAFYWQYEFSSELVAYERPDIVIQEIGERALIRDVLVGGDKPFPVDELVYVDFEERRAFRGSDVVLFSTEEGTQRDALLRASPDASEDEGGARLLVVSAEATPTLVLPGLPDEPGGPRLFRIDLDTEAESSLVVRAGEDVRLERRLVRGRNIAYATLGAGEPVRLELGAGAGSYVVRSVEVRALPQAQER